MSQASHNGNVEKRDRYRTRSHIFEAICILCFAFMIICVYTSEKGRDAEFQRVKEENQQISEYNRQLVLNGDTTTPRKSYVSVNTSSFAIFDKIFPAIVVMMISIGGSSYFKQKADVLESGIQGETMVSSALDQLTNEYEVLDNVQIHVGDRRAEIDSLVLSKYGIWIIEVKNHKGIIRGNVNNPTWIQDKVSSHGNAYSSEFKNPLRQANRQMSILKEMLQQNGINAFINVVVVFPSASSVNVNSDKVFSNMSDLNESIRKNKKVYFTQDKLNKIKSVLKGEKIVGEKKAEQKKTNTTTTQPNKAPTSSSYQQTFGEDDLLKQVAAQRARMQQQTIDEQNTQNMVHQMTNDMNESVHQQMVQQQMDLHNQIHNQTMMDNFTHQSTIDAMNASMNVANAAMHAVDHNINNPMNPF